MRLGFNRVALFCLAIIFFSSCKPTGQGIFGKKSPHEKYGEGIKDAGLDRTELGALWFAAANRSLSQPLTITLPYKETGYFSPDKPGASGYIFSVKKGEHVKINLQTKPVVNSLVFAELWQPADASNASPKLLSAADTSSNQLEYEIETEGRYVVRLQPELLKGIEYTISIITAPSLAFPVRSADNPRVTSLWGAARDGGSRNHEGIDIFAKRGTPVIASADGHVTSTRENNLGGKVVFLRPKGKNYSLYYAHLDSQIAQQGQQVKKGDVVGLMGNTGNAITTAPHLHFGIYTPSGAVDPYPFVNHTRPEPKSITASLKNFDSYLRNLSGVTVYPEPSTTNKDGIKKETGSVFYVQAATGNWYKVSLPDGTQGFVTASALTEKPLRKQTISSPQKLLDGPATNAAAKKMLKEGTTINILGLHNEFYFVSDGEQNGWITR